MPRARPLHDTYCGSPAQLDCTAGINGRGPVLIMVAFPAVQHMALETTGSDPMNITRCDLLPDLTFVEKQSLFTFSKLLQPPHLLRTAVAQLLHEVSDQILVAWGLQLDPDDMDLRWHDANGDTFNLEDPHSIYQLLHLHRPDWCRRHDKGPLLNSTIFPDFCQPYVMRLTCHRALPSGLLS